MLPHVIRFNASDTEGTYRWLLSENSESLGENGQCPLPPIQEGANGLAQFVTDLTAQAGLATRLSECGVERQLLPKLAADAARQWTTSFNPRPADSDALLELYNQAY
jgi:alcohol dehydrogenase class IV